MSCNVGEESDSVHVENDEFFSDVEYKFIDKKQKIDRHKKGLYWNFLLFLFTFVVLGQPKVFRLNSKVVIIGTLLNTVNTGAIHDLPIFKRDHNPLEHITGTTRLFNMYIRSFFVQILPNGTVYGVAESSNNTILQRQSPSSGKIVLLSVSTCLYLCMNKCGFIYGSSERTDHCVFHEEIGPDSYSFYISVKWSKNGTKLYLAFNKKGYPKLNVITNSEKPYIGSEAKNCRALMCPLKCYRSERYKFIKECEEKKMMTKVLYDKKMGNKICIRQNKDNTSQNKNRGNKKENNKSVDKFKNKNNDNSIDATILPLSDNNMDNSD